MKPTLKLFTLFLIVNFFTQCSHNPLDIDTSNVVQKPIEFKRLDKDLLQLTQKNIAQKTKEYNTKYSAFYTRFITSIVNTGGTLTDSSYNSKLFAFINDKDMSKAFKNVESVYTDNDIELLGEEMTEAVKRFKVFFPTRKTPSQFVTFMSGFNYNVVYVDSTVGIGLEMYLGQNNEFYSMLQFPNFRTRTMTKDYILSDAVRGWVISEFDNNDPVNTLLHHMIFYGKIFYACDALLPNVSDTLKFGYTTKQLNTAKQYEKNYWGFFVKDNKLFDNDLKIVSEFTSDGPFTRAISKECPPRIAMWLGKQIVKSYMEHNSNVTLNDLMNEKDSQKILSKSKYKP